MCLIDFTLKGLTGRQWCCRWRRRRRRSGWRQSGVSVSVRVTQYGAIVRVFNVSHSFFLTVRRRRRRRFFHDAGHRSTAASTMVKLKTWRRKLCELGAGAGVFCPRTQHKKRHTQTMADTTSASVWALTFGFYFGVCTCYLSIPLKIYPGRIDVSPAVDGTAVRRVALTAADGTGLSLASDPTGTVNFLDMAENLQGDSGRGYYIEMSIGTPGQKVMINPTVTGFVSTAGFKTSELNAAPCLLSFPL